MEPTINTPGIVDVTQASREAVWDMIAEQVDRSSRREHRDTVSLMTSEILTGRKYRLKAVMPESNPALTLPESDAVPGNTLMSNLTGNRTDNMSGSATLPESSPDSVPEMLKGAVTSVTG